VVANEELRPPDRFQLQKVCGKVIRSLTDQFGILDYWANAGIPFQIRVPAHDGNRQIEYFAPTFLDAITTDPIEMYLESLCQIAIQILEAQAQAMRAQLVGYENHFGPRMKYLNNDGEETEPGERPSTQRKPRVLDQFYSQGIPKQTLGQSSGGCIN
jgi:hypothetical protein